MTSNHPRNSDVKCPRCGYLLAQPWHLGDYPDWDCFACGLCVPDTVRIDGSVLIECLRVPEWREMLMKLVPGLEV